LEDIQTILMDMDCKIKGNTSFNTDGSYTVFINSKLCIEQQREVFIHELLHILNSDFDKTDVDIIEINRHCDFGGCL